jgi:putative Ca2+/H+ antiporter (TMEM165/GDT1 family)
LAAAYDSQFSVALGSILAGALFKLIGAFIGTRLLWKLPQGVFDYISSALFIAVGLYMLLL